MDNGQPELDVKKDETDIIMADPHSAEVYNIDEKYVFYSYSSFVVIGFDCCFCFFNHLLDLQRVYPLYFQIRSPFRLP